MLNQSNNHQTVVVGSGRGGATWAGDTDGEVVITGDGDGNGVITTTNEAATVAEWHHAVRYTRDHSWGKCFLNVGQGRTQGATGVLPSNGCVIVHNYQYYSVRRGHPE